MLGEGEKVEVKGGVIVAVLSVSDGVERQEGEGGQRSLCVIVHN